MTIQVGLLVLYLGEKPKAKEEDYFSLLLREEYSQFYIELVFRATLPFILTLKKPEF